MGKIGPDKPKMTNPTSTDTEDSDSDMDQYTTDKRAVRPKTPSQPTPTHTQNRYETLTSLDTEAGSSHTHPTHTRKPPPIIAEIQINNAGTLKTLAGKYTQDIRMRYTNNTLKIHAENREAYEYVINKLNNGNIKYHTYATERTNIHKRTLKGLPNTITETEIKMELENLNLPIENVRQLKRTHVENNTRTQTPLPIWILTFTKTEHLQEQINNTDSLFNVKIKFEQYKGLTGVTQCYRCQEFGHRAQYCHKTEKCVRCSGAHKVSNCSHTTKLKCANCNGDHPASYRQCPKYITQTESQVHTQTQKPQIPRQIPIKPHTWGNTHTQTQNQNKTDQEQFPALPHRDEHPQGIKPPPTKDTTNTLKDLIEMLTRLNITQHLQTILNIITQIAQSPGLLTTILNLLTNLTQTQHGP